MTDKECIFCKIAGGEIPSSTVYEDEDFRVILDLGPASKGHALILPKQHFKDLCELDPAIAAKALPLAGKIGAAMKKALGCTGFNVVQNNGEIAGQTVFHFHIHLIPRYKDDQQNLTWEQHNYEDDTMDEIDPRRTDAIGVWICTMRMKKWRFLKRFTESTWYR